MINVTQQHKKVFNATGSHPAEAYEKCCMLSNCILILRRVCSQMFRFARVPDFEAAFIYDPELHFDSAGWETSSPLRPVDPPRATP